MGLFKSGGLVFVAQALRATGSAVVRDGQRRKSEISVSGGCPFGLDPNRLDRRPREASLERALRRILPAVTAAATLLISAFTHIAAAQSDQQPTYAELAQHWAEADINAQLKGMKTSLRLTADQEKDWASFESAVKDAETARFIALQKEQSSGLTPMDRLNAKAERLIESLAGPDKIVEAAFILEPR